MAPGSPQAGGFTQLFLVGLAPSSLATALFPLALAATLALLEAPSRRRLVAAAAAAAALLLAHVVSFSLFALALVVVAALYLRDPRLRRWEVAAFPLLTAGLAAYSIVPVLVRRLEGYYRPAFSGETVARSFYSLQLFHKYFWAPLSKPLLVLALLGLVAAALARGTCARQRRALGLVSLLIPALWLIELEAPRVFNLVPVRNLIQLQRIAAELHLLVVLLAALGLGELARVAVTARGKVLPAGLGAAAAIVLALGGTLAARSHGLSLRLYTLPEETRARHEELYRVLARHPGRVLHEQTLFQVPGPLGSTHLEVLMPTYHGGEILCFDGFAFVEDTGLLDLADLLRTRGADAASQRALFERYNVRFVITTTAASEKLLRGTERLGTVAPWTLHETGIVPSWFGFPAGTLGAEDYRQTAASVRVDGPTTARLLFKVHDYPNWEATLDGAPARKLSAPGSLLEIEVPPGPHLARFRWRLVPLDVLSYGVTAATALLAGVLWRR